MTNRWNNRRGQGRGIAWLLAHVDYNGKECLIWPFSRIPNGYGNFGLNGKVLYAHRHMCELVNGPAPPGHEAAHSCGKGHTGCCHPKHLSWKTKSENVSDSWRHTPKARSRGNQGRLTPEQVREIRSLKGRKTQRKIAAQFKISEVTVRDIYTKRTYRHI